MKERWKPSVTVAAIVEDASGDVPRYLLIEEHTPEGLKLNNPAGHLDEGESPQQAVVREALEETTRHFTPECLVGVYLSRFQRPASSRRPAGEDITYLRLAYAGRVGEADASRSLDNGIVRTLWMTLNEVRASRDRHRSPLVLKCVEDFAAGQRYPLDTVITDATIYAPEQKT